MRRKKATDNTPPMSMEHACDPPVCSWQCAELADVIGELSRQVHLLGMIIDELVSEFQWQNNQMAEYIRQAGDTAERSLPVSTESSPEPVPARRTTLFE